MTLTVTLMADLSNLSSITESLINRDTSRDTPILQQ